MKIRQREILFASVVGLTATMALLTLPQLVAAPKLLFGRSLSAIAPSLFPYITLILILSLSVALFFFSWHKYKQPADSPVEQDDGPLDENSGWLKISAFFVLLTGYGLLLKPAGFLISSFLVIGLTSLLLGNRNWLQILLLAILAPICLYLIATRAMLVSLPELNQIELWYANAFNWTKGRLAQ